MCWSTFELLKFLSFNREVVCPISALCGHPAHDPRCTKAPPKCVPDLAQLRLEWDKGYLKAVQMRIGKARSELLGDTTDFHRCSPTFGIALLGKNQSIWMRRRNASSEETCHKGQTKSMRYMCGYQSGEIGYNAGYHQTAPALECLP